MRTHKFDLRLVRTKVKLVIKCDICGKSSHLWGEHPWSIAESEIKLHTGEGHPGGSCGDDVTVDLCPVCFEGKLLPWLKTQGVTPQVTQWSARGPDSEL